MRTKKQQTIYSDRLEDLQQRRRADMQVCVHYLSIFYTVIYKTSMLTILFSASCARLQSLEVDQRDALIQLALCPSALLPELQPAPCFLSAIIIIGQT